MVRKLSSSFWHFAYYLDILYCKVSGNSSANNELVAKTFRICKNFPVSIADALTGVLRLWRNAENSFPFSPLIFDHSPWSLEQFPHRFHASLVKLGPTCQCVNQFCKGRLWKGSPEVVSRKSWHQSLAQPVHWCQMLFSQPHPMRYKMQNENIET